jgi:hypothetical protein
MMVLVFDDGLFNASQIKEIVTVTGEQVGLADWRPKFGRFSVTFM